MMPKKCELAGRSVLAGIALLSGVPLASGEENADSVALTQLQEVVVTGQSARQRIERISLGEESLELSRLAEMPAFFGENDLIKSLELMPGVRGEGDGGGGFEVRGGTPSQNLILTDGISLYNPAHVMGIFSTFNDVSLSKATLYKGPIPAQFGGATSAVLDTSLAPGDMTAWHAGGTIGLLLAKLNCSGPIVRDKLSMALSARRSYADAFIQMVPEYRGTVMNFYDITAKFRWRPGESDIVDLSFVMGHDNMAIKNVMGMYWGNTGASVNWISRKNDNLSFATSGAFTSYDPKMVMSIMDSDSEMKEYIRDASVEECIDWRIAYNHALQFGFRSAFMAVESADMMANGRRQFDWRSGWNNSIWTTYTASFSERIEAEAGVRLRLFVVPGGERFHGYESASDDVAPDFSSARYFDAEPRVSLKFNINHNHNIRAGAGVTSQDLHSARTTSTSFPFDRYALTSARIQPERCVQYGIGYAGMTAEGSFDWSAEGYYRDLYNVYDYRDGVTMFSRVNIESLILGGRGRSYGLEFMLRKNSGPLTGWISYTLSRTRNKIAGINDGRWYDASNDRRHDIAVAATYSFPKGWKTSASWTFSSGHPLTAPDVKYELSGVTIYYYSQRNSYKTPPTHRLDLSATYSHEGRKFTYEWTFGVYNAYCRYNPYVIYFENDPSKPSGTRAVQQAMFGIVPSLSYTLKF